MEISLFLQLTVLSVIISFVLIQILDNKENLYLNATNPGSKKLMVVDQTTGAISFLNESVQGIDQAFATSDSTTNALLKALFGEEMDGTDGVFKTKMDVLEKRLNVLSCGTESCTAGRVEKAPGDAGTYVRRGSYFNLFSKTDEQKKPGVWTLPSLVRFSNKQLSNTGGAHYVVSLSGTSYDTATRAREDALWKIM